MMESFYLTDTKPLPFVCHPLFAHSSVIHYMFFTNAICQQNIWHFLLFDSKQTLHKSDATDSFKTCPFDKK